MVYREYCLFQPQLEGAVSLHTRLCTGGFSVRIATFKKPVTHYRRERNRDLLLGPIFSKQKNRRTKMAEVVICFLSMIVMF